jgi:hypothetical protein
VSARLFDILLSDGLAAGALVQSLAGHDRLRPYLVVRVEGCFVWLADGSARRLENPKKKRVRHVRPLGRVDEAGLARIEALGDAGQRNSALRKLLDTLLGSQPGEDASSSGDEAVRTIPHEEEC